PLTQDSYYPVAAASLSISRYRWDKPRGWRWDSTYLAIGVITNRSVDSSPAAFGMTLSSRVNAIDRLHHRTLQVGLRSIYSIVCHVLRFLWRSTEIAWGDAVAVKPFEGVYTHTLLLTNAANSELLLSSVRFRL
ncbi:MAG: hypothetical protein KC435_04605, partial [Thermomicrobiales bacterium]|nr:hypothetical protein [Thermomicrobiales bacterium]